MSKLGVCSRTEAARWIAAGRVKVEGRVVLDPEFPVVIGQVRLQLDDSPIDDVLPSRRVYLMLNKPRGLVTSARDEQGRDTVYRCFEGADLGWIAPVGRLDKASEGLLLFSNDPQWASRITEPQHGLLKTYHVQVGRLPSPEMLSSLARGVQADGDWLAARSVALLRMGEKNAWLEVVLDEGRNRHIRRLLAAFDIPVLRLVRVAIGTLRLGELPKGQWRELSPAEIEQLA